MNSYLMNFSILIKQKNIHGVFILKIQNLLIKNHEIVTEEQKAVLERVEMELVSIK